MDEYKRLRKKARKNKNKAIYNIESAYFKKLLFRILIVIVLTLITLISIKHNPKLKNNIKSFLLENSFSFAKVNKFYEEKFGSSIPFKDVIDNDIEPVFNEKLNYKESSKYLDGVKLIVDKKYLVPVTETGMVIFVGKKENYGNVVIIEDTKGIETWYGNINKASVKVYDYVDKGTYLGEVKDNILYMLFKKEGNVIDYTKYIY